LLLELGAGAGRTTPRYQGFERVVLLDYSLTQLQQAQERLGRADRYCYVAADIYRLPFVPALFDAATMIRALHHMVDAPLAIEQVRRVLQSQAVFVLEFASKRHLKSILRYALRRQSWSPFTLEPVEFVPLNFDFHPAAVRSWLEENDFEIQRQLTVSHFRIGLLKRLVPLRVLVGLDSAAQLTGDLWQLTPSVFVRSVAVGAMAGSVSGMPSPEETFFRCPACGFSTLEEGGDSLDCPSCSARWAVRDGIYDFRQPLD
jgi:SAM-dependent methyltransferase